MKQSLLSGKWGRVMVLVMIGLCSLLSISAQDDATEKKPERVAIEQPEASAKPAGESEDEDTGRPGREGEDAVMVGNDFVLKEDEVAKDVVVVSGNATIIWLDRDGKGLSRTNIFDNGDRIPAGELVTDRDGGLAVPASRQPQELSFAGTAALRAALARIEPAAE